MKFIKKINFFNLNNYIILNLIIGLKKDNNNGDKITKLYGNNIKEIISNEEKRKYMMIGMKLFILVIEILD